MLEGAIFHNFQPLCDASSSILKLLVLIEHIEALNDTILHICLCIGSIHYLYSLCNCKMHCHYIKNIAKIELLRA